MADRAEETVGPRDAAGPPTLYEVYRRERDGLVRFAAFVTGDVGSAVDIVQEAFADLGPVLDSVVSPGGWLRSAVARRSVSWIRRRVTARTYPSSQLRHDGVQGDRAEMAHVATRTQVRDAVARLTPQGREVSAATDLARTWRLASDDPSWPSDG